MEIKDLCSLENLEKDVVLNTLKERYEGNNVYAYIGDILISVKPKRENKIASKEIFQEYKSALRVSDLPPHIYGISCHIHQSLTITSENQCFIVSGESGAGKTENEKLVFNQFLSLCTSNHHQLVKKISQVSIILETFGNAKTSLNENSTRLGKYFQLFFSEAGKLDFGYVTEYLLEKSRVTLQRKGEQNFHIFYNLFSGRTDEELSKHLLDLPTQHRYLKYGEAFGDDNLFIWGQRYKSMLNTFTLLGFEKEDLQSVFGILSAILNIGDVKFSLQDEKTGVYVENLDLLDKVAVLLGVESDDLELCLTSNFVTAKDNSVSSFKNVAEANHCRDCLAKDLYGRLFGWIICKTNMLINPDNIKKKKSDLLNVGFLDMFGFEDYQKNSFEQLYINSANEQLQLHFTQHVFALEKVEYGEEELDFQPFDYIDNKSLINLLLEKPHGIFALVEEESKCLQADDNLLVSALNAHCSEHTHYTATNSKFPIFSINHSCKKVAYVADGFLEKNNEKIEHSLIECLRGSHSQLVSTLFNSTITRIGTLSLKTGTGKEKNYHIDLRSLYEKRQKKRLDNDRNYNTNRASHNTKIKYKKILTSRKPKPPVSMAIQFRNSLVDLMEKVLLCQAHFLRCIKPCRAKDDDAFEDDFVLSQIEYMGLIDTIKIRKYGYPVRLLFKTFIERYRFLLFPLSTSLEYTEENCKKILKQHNISGYKIGKTKIFLQLAHVNTLTEELQKLIRKITTTQKMVRGHLARIDFDFMQTNRKQEERNLGNLLVSISSKSKKMHDNLIALNDVDIKRHHKVKEKEGKSEQEKENMQKRKLTKTESDSTRIKESLRSVAVDSPNKKIPRSKSKPHGEVIRRSFTASSMSAWCRVDCYERQHHVASFSMDQTVICVEGTHPVSDKNRIAFAALPSRSEDSKVAKVKSCIGKGVQLHQDERQNLWATRLGKNPIFVRGHTLCPELVKLNGKLTQGVPMKVLDTTAFKEYVKEEVETNGGVTDEVKETIISKLKVCMSFIKDTVVDEETPCWFEVWLLKVQENVLRYLDNFKKRREHEEKRRSSHFTHNVVPTSELKQRQDPKTTGPEMRRAKSGDHLRTAERRPRSHTAIIPGTEKTQTGVLRPRPPSQHNPPVSRIVMDQENLPRKISHHNNNNGMKREKSMEVIRREKSMDVRLESRLLLEREYRNSMKLTDRQFPKKLKKGSPGQSPEQSLSRSGSAGSRIEPKDSTMESLSSIENSSRTSVNSRLFNGTNTPSPQEPDTKRANYNAPKEGMSYRQVFGLQSSDYLFNVTPPNYTRHRRFSDSDTESLHNFVHRIIPQDDSKNKVLQNIQPKKWLKKARRKSEDVPKKKVVAQLSNK